MSKYRRRLKTLPTLPLAGSTASLREGGPSGAQAGSDLLIPEISPRRTHPTHGLLVQTQHGPELLRRQKSRGVTHAEPPALSHRRAREVPSAPPLLERDSWRSSLRLAFFELRRLPRAPRAPAFRCLRDWRSSRTVFLRKRPEPVTAAIVIGDWACANSELALRAVESALRDASRARLGLDLLRGDLSGLEDLA